MTTTLRGLSTAHRPNLTETRFLEDVGYGEPRPIRWPVWVRIPFVFLLSGACWAAVIIFIYAAYLAVTHG